MTTIQRKRLEEKWSRKTISHSGFSVVKRIRVIEGNPSAPDKSYHPMTCIVCDKPIGITTSVRARVIVSAHGKLDHVDAKHMALSGFFRYRKGRACSDCISKVEILREDQFDLE